MSQQDEQAEQIAGAFTITAPPEPSETDTRTAPEPDETWPLPGGFAQVYRGQRKSSGIVHPVIVSDGFGLGSSKLNDVYKHLDGVEFPLATNLRQQDRDVILVGYEERSASLLDNAKTVTACIKQAQAEQTGKAPLVVGGFSMGGLITRYALASMEKQGADHRTAVYFSFDSPHRGAVVPVGLQAFVHFTRVPNNFAQQMNSPAARQMLWRHYDPDTDRIGIAPERIAFLKELGRVGGWPRGPRLLGVANGRSDGRGLPITPGDLALKINLPLPGTTFYAQARGKGVVVAKLKRLSTPVKTVTTDDFPELDGAPGGLMNSYGRLADELKKKHIPYELNHARVCFIPTVSAVAIRNIDEQTDLYTDIDKLPRRESELDDFTCSADTTGHTALTKELGTWLLDRLLV